MKHPHPTLSILKPIALLMASFAIAQGADTDFDGLDDAVKTNTGVYVSPSHTGTNQGTAAAIVARLSMAKTFQAAPGGNGRLLALETRTCDSVIETDSFSIKDGETLRLNQPGSRSTVIIRVTGNAPAVIAGKLVSNGNVILLSPGGIEITASGEIEGDGFVASTLEQLDRGFSKDQSITLRGSSEARLSNAGKWSAASGDIILIGRVLSNKGGIETKHGNVVMAASSEVTLEKGADDCLFVRIPSEAKEGDIEQTGVIKAACQIRKERGGNHEFTGEATEDSAVRVPKERTHGRVEIHAGTGRARVSGSVEAGCQEAGGAIAISGREVTVDSDANIDASGDFAAGTIKIGGGYQGKDDSIANSQMTRVMEGAMVKADCRNYGNGGTVIVWSDFSSTFHGSISAKGGALAGNGGFVEVSGKQWIGFTGSVDLTALRGEKGALLLDPANLIIQTTYPDLNGDAITGDDIAADIASGDFAGAFSIITSGQLGALLNSANVSMAATNNITVSAPISWSNPFGLTLTSGNEIFINSPISGGGGTIFNSPSIKLGANISTGGSQTYNGAVTLIGNATLTGTNLSLSSGLTGGSNNLTLDFSTAFTLPNGISGVNNFTAQKAVNFNAAFTTTGSQTYNGAVTPITGVTLSASTVNFNNSLMINGGGVGRLNVTGATVFGAASSFIAQMSAAGTANYDSLSATGAVTITNGATMSVTSTGGYVWNGADSFTMIENDGSDAIVGTFSGPTLANFLGSTSTSARSYAGGTGNDLVFAAPPGNLSINDVTSNEGNAGTNNFTFTVSLSSPAPVGGITFDIATANGTASTTNSDYVTKSLVSQTIPAGSSSYIFVVTVNGDAVFESNENFFVNVTNVSGSGVVVTDGQGLGTITNDDAADTDNDGVNDSQEVSDGTNPLVADSDGDGLSDGEEKTRTTNPLLADTDGDGYSDGYEVQNATNPKSSSSFPTYTLTLANNGTAIGGSFAKSGTLAHGTSATLTASPLPGYLFGSWSGNASGSTNPTTVLMNANKTVGASFVQDTRDPDADGLTNFQEIILRLTDPNLPDTDGDGVTDGQEVTDGTNPLVPDSDSDGLSDGEEKARATNPLSGDSDGDGLGDGQEANLTSTNPLAQDSDGNGIADAYEDPDQDGILNGREVNERNTNPKNADSDNDGLSDTYELVFKGTTDAFKPRIGDRLRFDLRELGFQGTYKLVGKLPVGMTFNATTGVLEGKLTGKAATSALTIQILEGSTVVRSIQLSLPVGAFPTTLTGSWQALLEDANGLPQGLVTARLSSPGKWSATLDVAGSTTIRKAAGTFDLDPAATSASMAMTFPAATGLTAQTLTLGVSGPDALASGTHPQGNLRGFRLARGAELPTANKAFTMVIDQGEQDGFLIPAGIGWATGVISTKGSITLSGQLGDTQAIKGSMKLGATGQALLWLKPYRNLSSRIGGVVSLHETGGVPATALAQNDSGLWWSRASDAAELSYAIGFAAIPAEVGVRSFSAPANSLALANSLGLTQQTFRGVLFDGAGLPDPNAAAALPESFALDASFKLIALPIPGRLMAPWQGAVNGKTGAFTGTLDVAATTTGIIPGKAAVSGVLFPSAEGNGVVGAGLVKIPIAGRSGSFRTAAVVLSR